MSHGHAAAAAGRSPVARDRAPSVRFPLVRSVRLLWALLVCAAVAPVAMGAVGWLGNALPVSRWAAFAGLWLMALGAAVHWWRRLPAAGWLDWNGSEWLLQPPQPSPAGAAAQEAGLLQAVAVAVDLQSAVLLQCRLGSGGSRWLWLERAHAPAAWLALRRALYAPAAVPGAGGVAGPGPEGALSSGRPRNNNDESR